MSAAVWNALRNVDDPEYPGISVVDMGMISNVTITGSTAQVEFLPTFSGCPALAFIETDIRTAVLGVDGINQVEVTHRHGIWDTSRLSPHALQVMKKNFTIAVAPGGCPRCGAELQLQSEFGPVRCRAIYRCESCVEAVEVMRR